jgi:hypothetical protein
MFGVGNFKRKGNISKEFGFEGSKNVSLDDVIRYISMPDVMNLKIKKVNSVLNLDKPKNDSPEEIVNFLKKVREEYSVADFNVIPKISYSLFGTEKHTFYVNALYTEKFNKMGKFSAEIKFDYKN